jgi:hypothetical protein
MRFGFCLIFAVFATAAAAAPRQIAIYNDADFAIVELQARAPKTKPWTIELLGKYSLGVGRATKAKFPANATACAYDLIATFDDGRKQQKLNVNICKPGTISFTGPV